MFQEVLYALVRGENFNADLSRWGSGFGHIQRDKGADRAEGVTDYFILNQGVS